MTVKITINSFDPLQVTMPESPIAGDVAILLPPIHIKVKDLSFGGIIPGGPYLAAEDNFARLSFTLTDGYEMSRSEIIELIDKCFDQLKEVWQIAQGEFDKQFLLD